ncbi:MAG: Spy/CpxP family protein refolding chaperone [Crocosphaera sp.]|nr:Spy/CpxP family protein refolding chaperone [Crocosphaera sp.]
MISKEFALIITVLTFGVGGTIALANSPQETPSSLLVSETEIVTKQARNRPERGERAEQFQEILNLSDEQMQQLSAIRKKYRPQMQQLREQMRSKGEEISQMMQGNASENDLRNKHQEIINLRQQMGNLRFESMLEMRKVLNLEQRQQFVQLMQKRRRMRSSNP